MLRLFVGAIATFVCSTAVWSQQATVLEGVKFEPTVQVAGQSLTLNGVGLRTRAIFKVYAAGLYVPQKASDPSALLAQKGPRRVQIGMLRSVDAETFAGSLNEGLKNNLTDVQFNALKSQIEMLNANLKALGEAKKGDSILFEFAPEAGTRIIVNGQPKGNAIAGEEFFGAVLRVWLGDKPADAGLKKGLLGG